MTPFRTLAAALSAAPLALWPATLAAQAVVQPLGPTDADALAAQMRTLGANPRDVGALATAGELSLKLGDISGAAALFARADKVDPRNGRVKAGMAAILVRSERPGEALRFYEQAASYGWPVARFAADRGLAYDLIGQNARAQADYRTALRTGSDDETVRRYALSLGISGQQALALAQLDPLVRRQDRAAWRARAFVMAMNGDNAGAARIATAMMPAAMNQGLGAFFQKLPTLSPTDRAFAVHFGEIYPTPERLADARLTPALPAFVPDRVAGAAPVQVAAAVPPQQPDRRRAGREPRRAAPQVAVPATRPVQMAAAQPVVQVLPGRTALPAPTASAQAMREADVRVPVAAATVAQAAPAASAPAGVVAQPAPLSAPLPTQRPPAASAPVVAVQPVPVATASVAVPAVASPIPQSAAPGEVVPVAAPVQVAQPAAPPAPVPVPVRIAVAEPVPPAQSGAAAARDDSVLARIVASLSIPASELGVAAVRPDPAPVSAAPVPAAVERAPASSAGRRVLAEASAKEARDVAVHRVAAARLTGDTRTQTAAAAAAPIDPKARRAAARKALADKQAAAEKKALADKAAAEKKAARAHPARIWVQVAGGANQGDLGKAWNAAKAKAPALSGRSGYATPLRATNRVLTGPFKTQAEARSFVNQLARQGVSGFSFTSDAGQEVTKLGAK